VVRLRMDIKS